MPAGLGLCLTGPLGLWLDLYRPDRPQVLAVAKFPSQMAWWENGGWSSIFPGVGVSDPPVPAGLTQASGTPTLKGATP